MNIPAPKYLNFTKVTESVQSKPLTECIVWLYLIHNCMWNTRFQAHTFQPHTHTYLHLFPWWRELHRFWRCGKMFEMVLRCMCLRVRNSIPIQIHEIKNTAKKKASLSNDRERAPERAHEHTSFRLVSEFWIELRRDKIVNELKRKRESEQGKEIERESRERGNGIELTYRAKCTEVKVES